MTGFPLLRLPFLPLKNVLHMMDLGYFTLLVVCSEKTRDAIKSAKRKVCYNNLSVWQKRNLNVLEVNQFFRHLRLQDNSYKLSDFSDSVHMELEISDSIQFRIISDNYRHRWISQTMHVVLFDHQNRYKGTKGNLKIGNISVPVIMTKMQTLYAFCNCQFEGLTILGGYLRKIFGSVSNDYKICGSKISKSSQSLRSAVKWMASQRVKICTIEDNDSEIIDDDYKYILDNVKPTWSYCCIGKRNEDFHHKTNFQSRYLKLNPANWFTLENLFNTESKLIYLYKSQLTNDDMKEFLKQWISGRFTKMEHLYVGMENPVVLDYILSSLPGYSTWQDITREDYTLRRTSSSICITRQDGAIANIYRCHGQCFEMSVQVNLTTLPT